MPEAVLLDTCAAIWLPMATRCRHKAAPRSRRHRLALAFSYHRSRRGKFATLIARNRLQLALAPEVWFTHLIDLPGVRLAPMPPTLLIASAFLPGRPPRDPADRIIAATARAHDLAIVTRDSELIPYGEAGHVVTIAC